MSAKSIVQMRNAQQSILCLDDLFTSILNFIYLTGRLETGSQSITEAKLNAAGCIPRRRWDKLIESRLA